MNKLFIGAIFAASLLATATATAIAQTDTNAPIASETPPANFFQSAEGYLTTFNTNYTWQGVSFEIAVGADYQSGLQWANDIDVQYDLPSTNSILGNVGLGYRMRNAGIAGVIQMNEAKVSFFLKTYFDTRVEFSLYGGYDDQYNCGIFEPQIDIRKKLTENTFAGIYLSVPIRTKSAGVPNKHTPNLGVETGFTF